MIKEFETLNDYVDGFLLTIYEEPEGSVKIGKTQFLEKFRAQLANIPSNKEGDELVKLLNRGLLKAKSLPETATLNVRKGFEEALLEVQNKIKVLFDLKDFSTGTIDQYLQDVPKINFVKNKMDIAKEMESILKDVDTSNFNETEKVVRLAVEKIKFNIQQQNDILTDHLNNNGRLIIMSNNGYSDVSDIEKDPLLALIASGENVVKKLDVTIEKTLAMIKVLSDNR